MARTAVVAGTATAVSNRVSRRQAGRWAAEDQGQYQEQYAEPAPAPAAAPVQPQGDNTDRKLDQLKELGELKAQGILTEEEFAAQKAAILG